MKTKAIILLIGTFILLTSWTETSPKNRALTEEGKIKVLIMYPNEEGKSFNMEYYINNHMPMVAQLFGESLKSYTIDRGISGRTPDEPMPFVAIGYFYFDQLSDYESAFGTNAEKILGDIPNYTDIQPVVQIGEVVK
jgi:uncharacterized protein (TIGR02118 family)